MVEDILLKAGLHPRPINTSGHVFVAGAAQTYDLWIPTDEEEDARELLTAAGYGDDLKKK